MAEELVRLTNQNDEMEEKVKEIPKLRIQLKVRAIDLQKRSEKSVIAAINSVSVSSYVLLVTVYIRIWSRGTTPSCRCMEKRLKRQRS